MDSKLVDLIQQQQFIGLFALRYEWLRKHKSCPFAETDQAWHSAAQLDAAIDAAILSEDKANKARRGW